MDPFEFMRKHRLFVEFSDEALRDLCGHVEIFQYRSGEPIIRAGQPGRFLGILASGAAEVFRLSETEGRVVLATFAPGDYFGEMSLVSGEPALANVTATDECSVIAIPADVFSLSLAANPAAIREIAKTITVRLSQREREPDEARAADEAWRTADDPYGLKHQAPARLLVLNTGSRVLKYDFYDTADTTRNISGRIDRIATPEMKHTLETFRGVFTHEAAGGVPEAIDAVLAALTAGEHAVIAGLSELTAVGHRVVHGGPRFSHAVVIDDDVIGEIHRYSMFAPMHNPVNLLAIERIRKEAPDVRQVAVFDTSFHLAMPQHAHVYGLPYKLYEDDGIRRYGSHGISHRYVAMQAATYMRRRLDEIRLITCHLGQGASVCAIDHGRSVDVSMGLSPLAGLVMKTRCGDIDPHIVLYLAREKGMSIDEIETTLNTESGVRGISGMDGDMREILAAAEDGEPRALLAVEVFCHSVRRQIGAYVAVLNGVDGLVFTGGIGRGDAGIRARICQGLGCMGISLDEELNREPVGPSEVAKEISDEPSRTAVLVIPDDEQWMIACETLRTLGLANLSATLRPMKHPIPIGVSAHHVHLTKEHFEALFGEGKEPTFKAPLTQPGQYACEETVNLIGPKGRIDRVRLLGPLRPETQVEIARTEKFKLGIDAPVRSSGELEGTPGITLEGTCGTVTIDHGVICARRHVHMSPEDALAFGLRDKDVISVNVEGERPLVFGDVLVRVHPQFRLDMHVDTDEANAADVSTGMVGHLDQIESRRAA